MQSMHMIKFKKGQVQNSVAHFRVTIGHLRVTLGHFNNSEGHFRVTIGHFRITIGHPFLFPLFMFLSFSKLKANTKFQKFQNQFK